MDRGDEARLVSGLRGGDRRAFSEVFSRLYPRIYSFVLRLSRRADVAEDLAQETFVRLARAAPRLTEDTRLVPYLFTVARNLHRNHRRWEMLDISRIFAFGGEADDVVRAHDAQPDTTRRLREVEAALGGLSVANREVLLLVALEGLSSEEAASVLGIAPDALRKRLSRARQALDESLQKRENQSRASAPGRRPT